MSCFLTLTFHKVLWQHMKRMVRFLITNLLQIYWNLPVKILWRMASAMPDLWLTSQPQGITAPWPVPNYKCFWCPGKVLDFFVASRVGTVLIYLRVHDSCSATLLAPMTARRSAWKWRPKRSISPTCPKSVALVIGLLTDYFGSYMRHICLQCFDAVGWAAGRASGL